MSTFKKSALFTGTVIASAMLVTPVYAQVQDDEAREPGLEAAPDDAIVGEPIVVTGSRIPQRNVDTAAPVAVVNQEEFQLSGTVNVENVINTLPQVVPGTTSFSNNPGNGSATLNLRGLGAARNLVLVNGRRWVFFDTAQIVDLNTIPSFLIESVDVVTGGASAVYGSDAIAGVTNFRLRDVQGAELGGQYAVTERGDGASYEIHGAIGTSFDDGRGSATVFGEYFNRDSVFQGDRAFSNFALGGDPDLSQGGSSTLPSGVIRYFGDSDTTGTDFDANGAVVFDTAGDFRTRQGDLYNYAPANYLQIPQERYLFGGYADYEVGGGHGLYTEVTYVNNRVAQELAATPVTGDFDVDLSSIADFLNPADLAQLQALEAQEGDDDDIINLFLQRRTVETGSRNSLDERNAFRVLGGITGPVTDTISYDAYYSFARTRNSNIQEGNISASLFQAGLDGTSDNPINIFGPNTLTPEDVADISILAQNSDVSTLEVVNASLAGTFGDYGLFDSDPIGFALGVEYRAVGSRFIPDTALASGDVIGFNAGQPTEGSYNVKEVFAELNVPIEFGASRLELTGAGRYSDYSLENVGGVWTYAGGVEFEPVRGVLLRGQYQRAIRAPNVGELFGGAALGFPAATDPCATSAATSGTLRDLCIANGVPAGSVGDPGLQLNTQIPATFGGNPDLEEETSTSYTFGVALQPDFVPGFVITADYFNIEIEDAISTISLAQSLALCFNDVQDTTSTACQPFFAQPIRNSAGVIIVDTAVPLGGQNIASFETSGIDLEVSYDTTAPFSLFTDTGESGLNFGFLGTWTEDYTFTAFPGSDPLQCAGFFGLRCGQPQPEFKWTSRASLIDGPVTASVRWRHLGEVDDETGGFAVDTIDSYDLIDLTFAFEATEEFTVTFGVNNLFDTLPCSPTFDGTVVASCDNSLTLGDNQEQANTYPSTYDVLGRRFFVSANFNF
ncbi:TonB-dependent receptor [Altererythrobacter aurantiacus]|uniref:TonB-dependent receptor n=1 Tax=Parapontixanthobacter aurantiacus TaxID=1463599 RepID=A0A844ZAU3_9SPHN|nr:TonB-dependent receptor [Parapontixanthobacter aurantiacus]MXO84634.1 TonB-dependent receptor [Parapontixanthobacter aurantiacus]